MPTERFAIIRVIRVQVFSKLGCNRTRFGARKRKHDKLKADFSAPLALGSEGSR